jgi:hypothetical protein
LDEAVDKDCFEKTLTIAACPVGQQHQFRDVGVTFADAVKAAAARTSPHRIVPKAALQVGLSQVSPGRT